MNDELSEKMDEWTNRSTDEWTNGPNGRCTLMDGTRVLVDDGHATGQPTRKNILRALSWLVKGAKAGAPNSHHHHNYAP